MGVTEVAVGWAPVCDYKQNSLCLLSLQASNLKATSKLNNFQLVDNIMFYFINPQTFVRCEFSLAK